MFFNKYASPDLNLSQFAATKQANPLVFLIRLLQDWNWRSQHSLEKRERLGGVRRVSRREEVFVAIFIGEGEILALFLWKAGTG